MLKQLLRKLFYKVLPDPPVYTPPAPNVYGRPYLVASEADIEGMCDKSTDLTHEWKRTLNDRQQAKARALQFHANMASRPRLVYSDADARAVVREQQRTRDDDDLTPFVLGLMASELTHRHDVAPTQVEPEPYTGGGGRSGGAGATHTWGAPAMDTTSHDEWNMTASANDPSPTYQQVYITDPTPWSSTTDYDSTGSFDMTSDFTSDD